MEGKLEETWAGLSCKPLRKRQRGCPEQSTLPASEVVVVDVAVFVVAVVVEDFGGLFAAVFLVVFARF